MGEGVNHHEEILRSVMFRSDHNKVTVTSSHDERSCGFWIRTGGVGRPATGPQKFKIVLSWRRKLPWIPCGGGDQQRGIGWRGYSVERELTEILRLVGRCRHTGRGGGGGAGVGGGWIQRKVDLEGGLVEGEADDVSLYCRALQAHGPGSGPQHLKLIVEWDQQTKER